MPNVNNIKSALGQSDIDAGATELPDEIRHLVSGSYLLLRIKVIHCFYAKTQTADHLGIVSLVTALHASGDF
jgi:hypothetical protein